MRDKCPYCNGTIEKVEHGDYPGDFDYWCSNIDCVFNDDAKDRADERWSDYVNDTWVDDDGTRHYY